MILTQKLIFVLERVENIVGKGENDGNQHFLLFLQFFQKLSLPVVLEVGIVWKKVEFSHVTLMLVTDKILLQFQKAGKISFTFSKILDMLCSLHVETCRLQINPLPNDKINF